MTPTDHCKDHCTVLSEEDLLCLLIRTLTSGTAAINTGNNILSWAFLVASDAQSPTD